MENTEIKQGGDLMLFANVNTAGEGETPKFEMVTLAFATSHKLSVNAETTDTTNKDNGKGMWKNATVKSISWNVTSENLYVETNSTARENQRAFGDLFDMMVAKQTIDIILSPIKDTEKNCNKIPSNGWHPAETGTYSGKVLITSLEANAPSGDNATYSVQMQGVSALMHNEPITPQTVSTTQNKK